MPLSENAKLRQQAKDYGLNYKLSQNFLVDAAISQKISDACKGLHNEPIFEIGPGSGFLTKKLLTHNQPLTVIEIDERFTALLKKELGAQITIIQNNALYVDFNALLSTPKNIIVGNLPYHLTGPLLFHTLGEMDNIQFPVRQKLSHAVFMIQKEVGDRLIAKPGDTQYSQLTLQLQFWYHIERITVVPKSAFEPVPKVDSMVVKLTPRSEPAVSSKDVLKLSKLIKATFLHRRKTALNSLKLSGYPEAKLLPIYAELNIDTKRRAQELSLQQYADIANRL